MHQDSSFIEIVDKRLASSDTRLPVFNTTALRIQEEIAKEEPDLRSIEKLVASDQSLTAKVLSVSNSSFYKGLQQVSTVRNAIVRLGINEVSNIVMLVTHENNFCSKDSFVHGIMRKLWRHSVGCAIGSNWLAKQCGLHAMAHEAFFAGLLHDVGMLFILTVIDDLKHSNELKAQPSDALLIEAMDTPWCGWPIRPAANWASAWTRIHPWCCLPLLKPKSFIYRKWIWPEWKSCWKIPRYLKPGGSNTF